MLNKTPNDKQLEIMCEFVEKNKSGSSPSGDKLTFRAMQEYNRFGIFEQDKTAGFIALSPRVKALDTVGMVINHEPFDSKCGVHRNQYSNIQKRLDTLESYYKRLIEAQ